jgi:hypothetical protein
VTLGPESVRTIPANAPRSSTFLSFAHLVSTPHFSASELSAYGYKLSASSSISFLALISNSRTSSFQALTHSFISRILVNSRHSNHLRTLAPKTGGYTPTWSCHFGLLTANGYRLSASCLHLTPFPTSLTQKQGGTGYWSYHASFSNRPTSEGGRYKGKRARQASPLQREQDTVHEARSSTHGTRTLRRRSAQAGIPAPLVAGHRPLATSSAILWSGLLVYPERCLGEVGPFRFGRAANSHRKVPLP